MKTKIKTFGLFLLVTVMITTSFLFVGCWDELFGDNNSTDDTEIVELTMDNFQYYLSISSVTTSTTWVGTMGNAYVIRVTISGAVQGLYKDCSIFYKIGKDGAEQEVKLNAAGFAQFSYGVSDWGGSFQYPRVTGQIII